MIAKNDEKEFLITLIATLIFVLPIIYFIGYLAVDMTSVGWVLERYAEDKHELRMLAGSLSLIIMAVFIRVAMIFTDESD